VQEKDNDRFRFINSINFTKEDLSEDPDLDKDYNPYFINKSLSYHEDTLLHAQIMDKSQHLSKKEQYLFLLKGVPKRKRFAKFVPIREQETEILEAVQLLFNYSMKKASAARNLLMEILNEEELTMIKQKNNKGGIKKRDGRK
jgi:hypothetical protein